MLIRAIPTLLLATWAEVMHPPEDVLAPEEHETKSSLDFQVPEGVTLKGEVPTGLPQLSMPSLQSSPVLPDYSPVGHIIYHIYIIKMFIMYSMLWVSVQTRYHNWILCTSTPAVALFFHPLLIRPTALLLPETLASYAPDVLLLLSWATSLYFVDLPALLEISTIQGPELDVYDDVAPAWYRPYWLTTRQKRSAMTFNVSLMVSATLWSILSGLPGWKPANIGPVALINNSSVAHMTIYHLLFFGFFTFLVNKAFALSREFILLSCEALQGEEADPTRRYHLHTTEAYLYISCLLSYFAMATTSVILNFRGLVTGGIDPRRLLNVPFQLNANVIYLLVGSTSLAVSLFNTSSYIPAVNTFVNQKLSFLQVEPTSLIERPLRGSETIYSL